MANQVSKSIQMQIWPDTGIRLPKSVVLKVFSFLKRGHIFITMRACKNWLNLSQDSCLWQREFTLLGLSNQPTFPLLSATVRDLITVTKKGELLLQRRVKTAREFDAAGPFLLNKQIAKDVRQKVYDGLQDELAEKLGLHEEIEKGFFAAIKLYKLGLKSLSDLEKSASVLLDMYGDEKGWYRIADAHIDLNNEAEAFKIIDGILKEKHEKHRLIGKMVTNYCRDKKLHEAIDLLKERYSEDAFYSEEAASTIGGYAEAAKDLVIAERLIDEIPSRRRSKLLSVLTLINSYLDVNQFEKAEALMKKYKTIIDQAKENYEVRSVIPLYVRLNQIEKAWALAEQNKEKDKVVFYVLRNAFSACKLHDEVEKVKKVLPPLPKTED